MSFLFRTDTIFYNAFSSVQDLTSVLSYDQTVSFCALLSRKIKEAFESRNLCCNAIFDLNTSDDRFFDSDDNDFIRTKDGFLYYGKEITEEMVSLINSCYDDTAVIGILAETRNEFRDILQQAKEKNIASMDNLRVEARQLTVI